MRIQSHSTYDTRPKLTFACRDFWGYYEPTREYMPMNCSSDVEAVIAHVDEVLDSGNATAIQALKDNFGLGSVTANDDFAWAREYSYESVLLAFRSPLDSR